jgi:ribosomal protein S18 acetylase RimI-like enzyme
MIKINYETKSIAIVDIKKTTLKESDLLELIKELDNEFIPTLSSKVNLATWVKKIYEKSTIISAINTETNSLIGALSFYCNDQKTKRSYIPFLGVIKAYRKQGLLTKMFAICFKYLRKNEFKYIQTQTWNGSLAGGIYKKLGFVEVGTANDRPNGYYTVVYEKRL